MSTKSTVQITCDFCQDEILSAELNHSVIMGYSGSDVINTINISLSGNLPYSGLNHIDICKECQIKAISKLLDKLRR